ncbi:ABC transporter substrate-binding protein [Martelella alba]|uniref:ABC transporter substrate-binding protein n=1 Tax=Martelella alba TaxID=2590451 RepID=A0ABY2SJN4_9HYPH|nr:ABC transporter substrate-binding protein [Martelella alba]TKI04297.1 ABC transporter substrate-binding protein [Martelella alba]
MKTAILRSIRLTFQIITLLSLGCAPSAFAENAKAEVRFAVLAPSALLWPHAVAKAEGMYDKHGISVRELLVGSSPALVQAVSSGSADAGAALGDITLTAIDKGAPITIAGSIIEKSILHLVVAKNVPDVKSLSGSVVSAGALKGGTVDLLRMQLADNHVDPDSVKFLALTNSKDRIIALENGQIKGALLIAPFDSMASSRGMKIVDVYSEPYIETALVYNKNWLASHRDTAEKMALALKEATLWLYDPKNKQQAIDILSTYTSTPKDICEKSYDFIIQQHQAIGKGLRVNPEGLTNIIKIGEKYGDKSSAGLNDFSINKYVDAKLVEAIAHGN